MRAIGNAVRIFGLAVLLLASGAPVQAAPGAGSDVLQAFLALWSRDSGVTDASVQRLYAPSVIYYGKSFTRAAVLADKLRFARHWPVRAYQAVPGSVTTRCERDGVHCSLQALITWQRTTRAGVATQGRSRLRLDFEVVEGNRKIVRESARPA